MNQQKYQGIPRSPFTGSKKRNSIQQMPIDGGIIDSDSSNESPRRRIRSHSPTLDVGNFAEGRDFARKLPREEVVVVQPTSENIPIVEVGKPQLLLNHFTAHRKVLFLIIFKMN